MDLILGISIQKVNKGQFKVEILKSKDEGEKVLMLPMYCSLMLFFKGRLPSSLLPLLLRNTRFLQAVETKGVCSMWCVEFFWVLDRKLVVDV